MDRYLDFVEREMQILSEFLDTSRSVTQMHFGGGTPTYFDAGQLDRHIKNIKKYFKNFSKLVFTFVKKSYTILKM